ncbi:MAG: PEP-CTERM sorting domain-containing protein [Terrimicrobiaceae bacterium]
MTPFPAFPHTCPSGASALGGQGFTTVPEPATWALLAGTLTTVMIFRRRRQA